MEEEDAAAIRKRKRDGDVVGAGAGVVSVAGGCCYGKELVLEEGDEEYDEAGVDEESVEEVMRWLEKEISSAGGDKDDNGFVTINGNEESCGPSFSAAASTIMAAVDTRAAAPPPPTPIPWPWPEPAAAAREDDDGQAAELSADEEEWLVELLTSDPALELWSLE